MSNLWERPVPIFAPLTQEHRISSTEKYRNNLLFKLSYRHNGRNEAGQEEGQRRSPPVTKADRAYFHSD